MYKIFVLFQLLATSTLALENTTQILIDFVESLVRLEAKGTLKYGEACNAADGQKHIDFEVSSHKKLSELASLATLTEITSLADTLKDSVSALCNPNQNLECNKDSNTCACTTPIPEIPYSGNVKDVNGECKYAAGSTCFSIGGARVDLCESGYSCKVVQSHAECTDSNVGEVLMSELPPDDPAAVLRISYNQIIGGACKCL